MGITGVRRTVTAALAGTVAVGLASWVPMRPAMGAGEPLSNAARVSAEGFQGVREIVSVGTRAFFVGATADHGEELWTSDGTTEGTRLVEDIRPGSASSTYYLTSGRGVALGNVLYFVADDGTHGGTLWRSDGTAEGTSLVKDVVVGSTSGYEVESLTVVDGVLYFLAVTGSGMQLWKSDGSGTGTVKVADAGTCDSLCYPGPIMAVGDGLVFVAGDDADGELWHSDGTAVGTTPLGPKVIRQLTVSGDMAYFTTGFEQLWQTDGTAVGTKPVTGAARGTDFVDVYTGLTDVDGELFYMVSYLTDSVGERYELRRVDGTTGNGTLVKGLGVEDGGELDTAAGSVVAAGGLLYFIPVTLSGRFFPGHALWRSDGTEAGTTKLLDGYAYRLAAVGGQAVFARAEDPSGQWRVWRSGGTVASTAAVDASPFKYPFGMEDLVEPAFADVGGQAYFTGIDLGSERGLWKLGSDVTAPDTSITGGFGAGETVTTFPGDFKRFTFASADDFTPTAGTVFQVQVDDGSWIDSGATYDFWVREFGLPIAEGPHTLRVRAVDAAGRVDATPATRSFTVDLEPPGPLANFSEPGITGTPRLGAQLGVTPGEWAPDPAGRSYQWLRDGSPIAGATGTSYVVTLADVGRSLRVREQATATDYLPTTATSASVVVAKLASVTKLTLKSAKVSPSQRAKAVIKVTASGGASATGKVTVSVGTRKIGTGTLSGGKVTITLARLAPGTYLLKATYAGSKVLRSSSSTKVKLVVTR